MIGILPWYAAVVRELEIRDSICSLSAAYDIQAVFLDSSALFQLSKHTPLTHKVLPIILVDSDVEYAAFCEATLKRSFPAIWSVNVSRDESERALLRMLRQSLPVDLPSCSDIIQCCVTKVYKELDNPDFNLLNLKLEVGCTQQALEQEFRRSFGTTVWQTVLAIRIFEACRMLQESEARINEVARAVGFDDFSAFNKRFRAFIGTSASNFRQLGRRDPAQKQCIFGYQFDSLWRSQILSTNCAI